MFTSYCRILWRNLRRLGLYALINILALGIGIAAMIWGIQVYRFNTSYDSFHVHRDHIFRVLITVAGGDGLKGTCPAPVGAAAVRDFPGVQAAVRWEGRPLAIMAAGKEPFSAFAHFTDPGFFPLFSFPLVRGEARLSDPSTIVITETAARKYFGAVDAVGKTLTLYSDQPYKKILTVTGILKDPPVNSSIQFETLTSTDNFLGSGGSPVRKDDWGVISDAMFLKLADPRQAAQLSKAFDRYVPLEQAARQDIKVTSFKLESLPQTAAQSGIVDKNAMLERPGDAAVVGPLILGCLILLSACLNFANTTVSQSRRRLKEIGIRKVMGSSRRQLILQQLLECAMIVLPAAGLAMLLDMCGAEVRVAYGGKEALALLDTWTPDAAVIDIGMPDMDGCQVAGRIRADARLAGLRLVALTGWGQSADRARSQAAGFDAHLTKPADIGTLTAVLAGEQ